MTPTPADESLKPSSRALRYGVATAVVVIGILCGAIIPGTTGGTICTAVVGIGLVGVVSLVFYDVGLTEDRDRARGRDGDGRARADRDGGPGADRDARPRSNRTTSRLPGRDDLGRIDRSRGARRGRIRDEHGGPN